MSVNRFMKPASQPLLNTYVKLPFQEMSLAYNTIQKEHDAGEILHDSLDDKILKVRASSPLHSSVLSQIRTSLDSELSTLYDKHGGRYEAVCQRNGKVKVYRDGNKDDLYDFDSDTITEGSYGINIHRSSAYKTGTYINKYSAGCQVFADPDDFDDFMEICHKSKDVWGNAFTYTLIESKDI